MKTREELRDEFAAAALTGLLAHGHPCGGDYMRMLVERSYACADAALAHRDANPLPAPGPTPTRAPQP